MTIIRNMIKFRTFTLLYIVLKKRNKTDTKAIKFSNTILSVKNKENNTSHVIFLYTLYIRNKIYKFVMHLYKLYILYALTGDSYIALDKK